VAVAVAVTEIPEQHLPELVETQEQVAQRVPLELVELQTLEDLEQREVLPLQQVVPQV
jgi:hypothetical protein